MINKLKSFLKRIYQRLTYFINKKPLTSFFAVLGLLFLLILLGNFLTPKKQDRSEVEIIKDVQIFKIGETPKVSMQAKIEKSGVIKITALAPGVIQSVKFKEGETVSRGSVLVNMSSNYQRGNAASVQRNIAAKQYQNSKDTLNSQKDIIQRQKELTEKDESNSSQLRDITNQSISETKDLINFNQSLLDTLSGNQTNLENNNPGGINDATILQIRSQRAQIQSGLNQLKQGLRQTEYSSSNDRTPSELAKIQKDITLKQLDLQQKGLELGLEISKLQLVLAQINEALYFPSSPFTATVQRVYVKEGEAVNPGTHLMTLSAKGNTISAIVSLPQNLAGSVSSIEPSILYIGEQTVEVLPNFVSTEATDGTLYSIIYIIPDSYSSKLVEGGNISVDIPVGISQSESSTTFIPLDSIYQSADKSIVLVVIDETAVSKEVILGEVFGRFVEVKQGLSSSDKVILNRNVLSGDKVSIQK